MGINKVNKFKVKALVIHGELDQVIHVHHGKTLAKVLQDHDRLYKLQLWDDVGHNDVEAYRFKDLIGLVNEYVDTFVLPNNDDNNKEPDNNGWFSSSSSKDKE